MPIIITTRPATLRKMIRRVRLDMLRCVKNCHVARAKLLVHNVALHKPVTSTPLKVQMDTDAVVDGRKIGGHADVNLGNEGRVAIEPCRVLAGRDERRANEPRIALRQQREEASVGLEVGRLACRYDRHLGSDYNMLLA